MMKRRPVLAALIAPLMALGEPAIAADKTLTVGAAVFPDSLRWHQFLRLAQPDDANQ
jgi:hypothetical protein